MLRPVTVEVLSGYLQEKMPRADAFPMPRRENVAKMLKADLKGARQAWITAAETTDQQWEQREESGFLTYTDSAGRRADFHSFRHTTGSWLAAAGVHPKVIQRIMRHSSITLTLDRYAHTFIGDEAVALAQMPSIDGGIEAKKLAS